MINIVVELSKYVILTLMIVYTVLCYYLVVGKHASDRKGLLRSQITLTFFLDFTAFVVIFLKTFDFKVVIFYAEMMIYFAAILILYRRIYKNASMLLLNNMCMLLSVGFIMLCRLDIASANKQLLIVACGSAVALVIPVMIRKMKFLKDLTWIYAGIGIILLAAVFFLSFLLGWYRVTDKLRRQAFSDGNPAFRGDQAHLCVLYGIPSGKRGNF